MFLDKAMQAQIPVWIVSLDLSKAFDRVHWPALWEALRAQLISDHLTWILHKIYEAESGQISGESGYNKQFPIKAGVRQGCVLSPRCSVRFSKKQWVYGV